MSFRALQMGTADLQRARLFWTQTMGLEELSSGPDFVTLVAGETHWTLTQSTPSPAIAHFAFNVPENRFAEAVAWLRERVPLLSSAHGNETLFDFTNWNAHAVYFTDADGNIAELIARHTLASSRRERFEILGISEIGVVTGDVPGTVAQLGLPAYRQGSSQFQPVGDEEGLLIVVQRDRPWYPDNRHTAQPIPFSVTLANGRNLEFTNVLTVQNGMLLKDGKRCPNLLGVNYFDAFLRHLHDEKNTSFEAGFAELGRRKIPFARLNCGGFWPVDWKLWQTEPKEYFVRLDRVFASAQKHKIGLIPSLCWNISTFPDLVGEHCGEWGEP